MHALCTGDAIILSYKDGINDEEDDDNSPLPVY